MRSFNLLFILILPVLVAASLPGDSVFVPRTTSFFFARQISGEPEWGDSINNLFEIRGNFQGSSTSIPFQIPLNLLFQCDINSPLKQRTDFFPGNDIRYEDELSASLRYAHRFKKTGFWIQLRYAYRTTRHLYADKNVYGLVFYGNARYEDRAVSLDGLEFANTNYVKMGVGFGQRKTLAHQLTLGYGIHLDVLQGINVQKASNRSGYLYTAPDGEYLEAQYDLTFNIGREGAVRYTDFNGIGGSGDAFIYLEKRNHRFSLSVQDLGYLYFKKYAVNYSGQDSIQFKGIVISDLLNIGGQRLDSLNTDSLLKSYLPAQTNNAFGTWVPMRLDVAYSYHFPKKGITLTAGLRWKNLSNYYAYGYLQTDFFLKKNWIVSVHTGAGSYDLFNLGFQLTKFWKQFFVTLSSDNLTGTILPMYYPGGNVMLRGGLRF